MSLHMGTYFWNLDVHFTWSQIPSYFLDADSHFFRLHNKPYVKTKKGLFFWSENFLLRVAPIFQSFETFETLQAKEFDSEKQSILDITHVS